MAKKSKRSVVNVPLVVNSPVPVDEDRQQLDEKLATAGIAELMNLRVFHKEFYRVFANYGRMLKKKSLRKKSH